MAEVLWNYKSPIEIMQAEVKRQMEGSVIKAIAEYSIKVNKEELIKALNYDRGQYEKGYADATRSVVRCCNCEYGTKKNGSVECARYDDFMAFDDFCSKGIRKDGAEDGK